MATKRQIVVPFTRVLKRKMAGRDVLAVKRALIRKGVLHQRLKVVTPFFRGAAERAVKEFQSNHHLPVTGIYDRKTHSALVSSKAFDAHGAALMTAWSRGTAVDRKRKQVVAAALFAFHHAPRHYTQDLTARMDGVNNKIVPPEMWNSADCSGMYLWLMWLVGFFLKAGGSFSGGKAMGYTGTIAKAGKKISFSDLKPADGCLYGPFPTFDHVTAYIGNGRVISHGYEGGPRLYSTPRYRDDLAECRRMIGK